MLDSPQRHADSTGLSDSRAQLRLQVHSLAYIELTDNNAGMILNISETGIAVQAVQVVTCDSFEQMRFRLPRTEERIEAAGRLAWQIRSKKEAGIEFVDLPAETRAQISAWIDAERDRSASPELAVPPERPLAGEADAHLPLENQHERNTPLRRDGVSEQPLATPSGSKSPADLNERLSGELRPTRSTRAADTAARKYDRSAFDLSLLDETFPPERQPEGESVPAAIPNMPRPNEQMAPLVGTDFKQRRFGWVYAALGLIAVLGFASVMMFKPIAMTQTRVKPLPLPHRSRANDAGPDRRNGQTNEQRPSDNTSGVENTQNSPSRSLEQPAAPNNAASSAGASGKQLAIPLVAPAAPATPSNATPVGVNCPAPVGNSSVASASGPDRLGHQPRSDKYSLQNRETQNAVPPRQPTSRYSPHAAGNARGSSRYASNRTLQERIPATNATDTSKSQANFAPSQEKTNPNVEPRVSSVDMRKTQTEQNGAVPPANQEVAQVRRQPAAPASSSEAAANPAIPAKNNGPAQRQENLHAVDLHAGPTAASASSSDPATGNTLQSSAAASAPRTPVKPSAPLPVASGTVMASSRFYGFIIPPELQSSSSQVAGQLRIGQPVSSYPPVYPIEAAREGIQGTVKLDVTVNRDGSVKDIRAISGPVMLMSAAATAVRGWRYQQTLVGGHGVEAREYVTVVFRIAAQ